MKGARSSQTGPGEKLCDAVYLLQKPRGPPEIEIVFIHGLQDNGNQDAYWKTWLRQGSETECWPVTWFQADHPNARVLSVSYDACVVETATTGRMDLYALGESLIDQMCFSGVGIGQNNCPIVFVCHSVGGLVAKQIAVTAYRKSESDVRIGKLLQSTKGFFYYGTPHAGSTLELEYYAKYLYPIVPREGPLVSDLRVLNDKVERLNDEFTSTSKQYEWEHSVVAETHETTYTKLKLFEDNIKMVEETSARVPGYPFLQVGADHNNICKPGSTRDSSFLALLEFLSKIMKSEERDLLPLPSVLVGTAMNHDTLIEKLAEAEVVGVVGMGGIGKSTLCKSVYNLQCGDYERSCFLEDIKSKSLEVVQQELYKGLIGGKIDSVEPKHLKEISDMIKERKVLIVYDDVWNEKEKCDKLQIEAFMEGSGNSRAILTSRNWQLLQDFTDVRMDMKFLDEKASLELFDFHAYRKFANRRKRSYFEVCGERNDAELQDLRIAIVKACSGLPLSLQVIGSYLGFPKCVDVEFWKEAKEKLERAETFTGGTDNDRLWKKLKISFDVLEERELKMFAFIATFHIHLHRVHRPIPLIEVLHNYGRTTIQNLVDRCLIQTEELAWDHKPRIMIKYSLSITVHDQLRDLGLKIVRDCDKFGLAGAFCVWDEDTTVAPSLMETKAVDKLEGLYILRKGHMPDIFPFEQFSPWEEKVSKFASLKALIIDERRLSEQVSDRIEEMRAERDEIFQDILEKRTILDLRSRLLDFCSRLGFPAYKDDNVDLVELLGLNFKEEEHFETGIFEMEEFDSIAEAIIHRSYCNYMFTEKLPSLESLTLIGCLLRCLSGFLEVCTKLRWLSIRDCQLKGLPTSLGTTVNLLEYIFIELCHDLREFPKSIGNLTNLKVLWIASCESLEELPVHLGNLRHLQILAVICCDSLRQLPEFSTRNLQLRYVEIRYCSGLRFLPPSIGNLHHLQALRILGCRDLDARSVAKIVDQLHHLKFLELDIDCDVPSDAPCSIWQSSELEHLDLKGYSMKNLGHDYLSCLSLLRIMRLESCSDLPELPPSIGRLLQLEELHLSYLDHFESPEEICELPKLRVLELVWDSEGCTQRTLPSFLGKLSQLKTLRLMFMSTLEYLPATLKDLSRLSELTLVVCEELRWREDCQLSTLKSIRNHGCEITLPDGEIFTG